jgi:hypothetical protein
MVVKGGVGAALLEIPFESRLCCFMQGHKAALTEFGASNHQAIGRNVIKSQVERFGHSQSRACEQGEQRAVRRSTDLIPRL